MKERVKNKKRKDWLFSYLWSAPSLILIGLIVVFPILYTAYISLTNMSVYHWFDYRIIGLSNYVRALFVFDSGFLGALLATILWTVVNMLIQLVLAFVLILVPEEVTGGLTPRIACVPLFLCLIPVKIAENMRKALGEQKRK